MIQANNVFHHFGGKPVLRQVSLTARPGEVTVLMGPNGMGKSTLLSCIGGAIVPRAGSITVNGLERYSTPEAEMQVRAQVMYLPDSPWIPHARTCREWAFAVGSLYNEDAQFLVDHISALISIFEMDRVADSPISSYSAGQRKKSMLISALAARVKCLVLDEPFSGGLDPVGLLAIKDILKKRARLAGNTILLATPTPELIEETADRIVILRDGVVMADGTLNELRAQANFAGNLEGVYERLSCSDIQPRLAEYEARFLR